MKAVLERLSRQNAALSEKVEELERRGRSSEVSKEEQVLDATQKNIEISNILEERLECLKTVVTKLELKALRAVQESTLRCSTSRTDLEEGTDAEIDKLSESLEEVRMSFIEFKQEYQDTMRYLKTDVQHLIMELDNDLMSRWRKQEEALEAMRKQMESERQQFNLDLSAKDEMLAKVRRFTGLFPNPS